MKLENDFEQIARRRESSFLEELWTLLHEKKKYWLMPIVIVLLLFGLLVFLSGTAAAPFIYTIF
jgi:peptidoglycan/LPS O-acetylase OafA/YrhL